MPNEGERTESVCHAFDEQVRNIGIVSSRDRRPSCLFGTRIDRLDSTQPASLPHQAHRYLSNSRWRRQRLAPSEHLAHVRFAPSTKSARYKSVMLWIWVAPAARGVLRCGRSAGRVSAVPAAATRHACLAQCLPLRGRGGAETRLFIPLTDTLAPYEYMNYCGTLIFVRVRREIWFGPDDRFRQTCDRVVAAPFVRLSEANHDFRLWRRG